MLHGGHVSGLENPGALRCDFAGTGFNSDVHDPGNTKMAYLKRKIEDGAKIPSVVARQEHGYNRGIKHD